ncbi:MAG: CARDB domain-containing protein [Chitinophagales bacterium]
MVDESKQFKKGRMVLRSWIKLLMLVAVLAIATVLLPAAYANAATITVTDTSDVSSGDPANGSLRWAVNTASAGDTIQFSSDLTRPIAITLKAPLTITKSLTIDGGNSITDPVTIDGGDSCRGFKVTSASLFLNNLTLSNCNAPTNEAGGAINFTNPTATDAVLSLSNCRVKDNQGQYGGGIYCERAASITCNQCVFTGNADLGASGGGLYAIGTSGNVTLNGCSFHNNFAKFYGAAVACHDSNTIMTNCTFSHNVESDGYGAAYIVDSFKNRTGDSLSVFNCTFAGNTGSAPQGLYVYYIDQVTRGNDIFWDDSPCMISNSSSQSDGYCIIKNYTPEGTMSNQDPLLGTYGSYGGILGTIPLLPGSPAIDAGDSSAAGVPATDARGVMRYNGVDIGAFESQGFTITPQNGSTPQNTAINTAFTNPLALYVAPQHAGEPVAGGVVTFTAPTSGASATLGSATAQIIEAFDPAWVAATANGTVGSYVVRASVNSTDYANFSLFNTGPGSAENDILTFSFAEQTGPATINTSAHTVEITVQNASLNNLTPTITVSPGASINPASGVTCDFRSPVLYLVTAENGLSQAWAVTVSASGPDLALDGIDPPTEVAAGTKVTLNIKVINIGEAEAAKCSLAIDLDGQLLATKSVSKLKVKQSKIIKVRVTIPADPGAGWIAVRAIPSGPDKNLENNMYAIPVKVVVPDLTITSFAPKGTLVPGKTGTMTMTIENLTIAKASKFDVVIGYGENQILATKKVTSLKQGTKTLNIRFKVPIDYVNTNPLVAVVDPYNAVVEENENNNFMYYPTQPG